MASSSQSSQPPAVLLCRPQKKRPHAPDALAAAVSLNLLTLSLAVVCLVFLALLVAPRLIGPRLERRMIAAALDEGVTLQLKDALYGWNKVEASSVDALIRRPGLVLSGTLNQTRLTWHSLLLLSPTVKFSGDLYGGKLRSSFTYKLTDGTGSGLLDAAGIQLSRHPQLRFLGLNGGTLNLVLSQISIGGGGDVSARGSIELFDIERRPGEAEKFLPIPLKIPDISEGRVSLDFSLAGQVLKIDRFESNSSLGSANGSGSIGHSSISVTADVALTQEGLSFLGPYLPLLSGNRLREDQGIFHLKVNGSPRKPAWQVTAP